MSQIHSHRRPLHFHVALFLLPWPFADVLYKLFIMKGSWWHFHIRWLSSPLLCGSTPESWWECEEMLLFKIKHIKGPRTCLGTCCWARWYQISRRHGKNSWCPVTVSQENATCLNWVSAGRCAAVNTVNSHCDLWLLCTWCKTAMDYVRLFPPLDWLKSGKEVTWVCLVSEFLGSGLVPGSVCYYIWLLSSSCCSGMVGVWGYFSSASSSLLASPVSLLLLGQEPSHLLCSHSGAPLQETCPYAGVAAAAGLQND